MKSCITLKLNDEIGSLMLLDMYKRQGITDENLIIDAQTPFHIERMNSLPVYQRKILSSMVRYGKPLKNKDICRISRIFQQNNVASQVSSLVEKGFLTKNDNKEYLLNPNNVNFNKYLQMRIGGMR